MKICLLWEWTCNALVLSPLVSTRIAYYLPGAPSRQLKGTVLSETRASFQVTLIWSKIDADPSNLCPEVQRGPWGFVSCPLWALGFMPSTSPLRTAAEVCTSSAWCELTTNWVWPMRDKLSNRRNTIRKLWLHRCMLGNTGPEYFSPFLSLLRPAPAAWAMFLP